MCASCDLIAGCALARITSSLTLLIVGISIRAISSLTKTHVKVKLVSMRANISLDAIE